MLSYDWYPILVRFRRPTLFGHYTHFEPFGNAQGTLREKSLFRPKGEIYLRSLAFARDDNRKVCGITTQSLEGEEVLA
jgi:hypothetical protein